MKLELTFVIFDKKQLSSMNENDNRISSALPGVRVSGDGWAASTFTLVRQVFRESLSDGGHFKSRATSLVLLVR